MKITGVEVESTGDADTGFTCRQVRATSYRPRANSWARGEAGDLPGKAAELLREAVEAGSMHNCASDERGGACAPIFPHQHRYAMRVRHFAVPA
jgi:hypothetical protein